MKQPEEKNRNNTNGNTRIPKFVGISTRDRYKEREREGEVEFLGEINVCRKLSGLW